MFGRSDVWPFGRLAVWPLGRLLPGRWDIVSKRPVGHFRSSSSRPTCPDVLNSSEIIHHAEMLLMQQFRRLQDVFLRPRKEEVLGLRTEPHQPLCKHRASG